MGWMDTILNVADVAIANSINKKIYEINQSNHNAKLTNEALSYIKNKIFLYKQNAIKIIDNRKENPKVAASALLCLNIHYKKMNISPDIFNDFSDKEYVLSSNEFIDKNSKLLLEELSKKDNTEVIDSIQDFVKFIEMKYLIDNFNEFELYIHAMNIMENQGRFSTREVDEAKMTQAFYSQLLDKDVVKKLSNSINTKSDVLKRYDELKMILERKIGNLDNYRKFYEFDFLPKIQKSILILERNKNFGGAIVNMNIFIDNQFQDEYSVGAKKKYLLTSGTHIVSTNFKNRKLPERLDIEINLSQDESRYYKFGMKSTFTKDFFYFEQVND